MEMDIEVQRTGLCAGFCVAGLVGQVRGNDPVDDSQHFAQNHGLTGQQIAQWERHTENPLTHGQ